MEQPCCLAFVDDEKLRSQLEVLFKAKKIDHYFIRQGEQVVQLVKNWMPFMLLVGLTSTSSGWLFRYIAAIEALHSSFPIVAFVSNDAEEAVWQRAETYGCSFVFKESELLQELPDIIENILTKKS